MTRFILGSAMYLLAAMSAFAGPGYYELRVSDCSPAAMQRAVDSLSAQNRAVISVVKCDASAPAVVAAPAPVYVAPVVFDAAYVEYDDFDCDCDMEFAF